jgi:hypothetical protein
MIEVTTTEDIDDTMLDLFAAVVVKAGGSIELTPEEWNAGAYRSYRFECKNLDNGRLRIQVVWCDVN